MNFIDRYNQFYKLICRAGGGVITTIIVLLLTFMMLQADATPDFVQLAYFYKPPLPEEQQQTVIDHFDTIILTRNDEWFRERIIASGDPDVILQYVTFERIHDPCHIAQQNPLRSCACNRHPNANNVAWNRDDVCNLVRDHPDWFLRNDRGEVIYLDEYVFMDIGNPDWQHFFLNRLQYAHDYLGWQGVFLDNVRGSLERFETLEQTIPRYPTDEMYVAATESFLSFIYENFSQVEEIPLYANLRSMPEDNHEVWNRYLAYLDGAMDEYWAIDWGYGYLTPEQWKFSLQRLLNTQAQDDTFIAVTHGEPSARRRQLFAFASFLLVTDGTSTFRYVDMDDYDAPLFYENYTYDLGMPLGEYYHEAENWRRDFEKGYVTVNPMTHDAAIILHRIPDADG